jgi:hypothetical protein
MKGRLRSTTTGERRKTAITRFVQAALIATVALFLTAGSARADIVLNTNAGQTDFVVPGPIFFSPSVNSSSGQAATLSFTPISDTDVPVPSPVEYGHFTLTCSGCGATGSGLGATFSQITFQLDIDDTTDGAHGTLLATTAGSVTVYTDSTIEITWAPTTQLGPGGNHSLSGSFGSTYFTIGSSTAIAFGDTALNGDVGAVPEPATLAMVGGAIIGLAALARKRRR